MYLNIFISRPQVKRRNTIFYCVFLSEVYCNKDPEKVSHDRKPTYNERVESDKYPTFFQMIKLLVSRELVLNQLYLNGILRHAFPSA